MSIARIGILTISDRASRGEYEDKGGPAIHAWFTRVLTTQWQPVAIVIPDEQPEIEAALRQLSDVEKCCLIVTTGGTGLGPRDVTPEATREAIDYEAPGLAEAMRAEGLKHTPMAMLSRAVAGVRGRTLIVNLPGNPEGVREWLEALSPLLIHAFEMIEGGGHEHESLRASRS